MKKIVRQKFSVPALQQKLLDTGDEVIAEAVPFDDEWSCGLTAEQLKNTDPKFWPGHNYMGKILMELREELAEKLRAEDETFDEAAQKRKRSEGGEVVNEHENVRKHTRENGTTPVKPS